jgi:23S rRNA (adenine2503-C2)-methyltransferase
MNAKSTGSKSRISLKDCNREELQDIVATWGEKRFHGKQIFASLFRRRLANAVDMTDLPLRLRDRLAEFEPFDLLSPDQTVSAGDGTFKVLFELLDGSRIESVWIPERDHATVCLSTQVGCSLDCTFCATGKMGFARNLSSGEIIDQVIHFQRQDASNKLRNLVFMGMGEPLLNYRNLVKAIRILSASDGPSISQHRMTVSTVGLVSGIRKLASEGLKAKLAISLNAPTDALRDRLMPINRKYPLDKLMGAAFDFYKKSGKRITFEYALMPGLNATPEMIRALRDRLTKVPCKLNLIPLNPIDRRKRKPTDWDDIFDRFYEVFAKERITLTLRRSRGAEIQAACGQLAGKRQTA